MACVFRDPIVANWRELRAYAVALVADVGDDAMVGQPVDGVVMNHPAWILSHLAAYGPVVEGILRGEPVEDPLHHPFGRGSVPSPDRSLYLPKGALLDALCDGYDRAADALLAADDSVLERPTPIERWLGRFPTVAFLPSQFFVKHMATHLGQLSAWRRAGGLGPV